MIAVALAGAAGIVFVASLAPGATGEAGPSTTAGGTPYLGDLQMVSVPPAAARSSAEPATATATATVNSPSPSGEASSSTTNEVRAERIRIDRLDIDLAIIEGDGIDAPTGKAAHYPGSAWPGGGSNIYIYGHARKGMFLALWKTRVGDTIELDLVDGTSRAYVVKRVLPKVPWNAVQYLKPTSTEQLTLQTSTSYYPTAPRFVVIAVPAT